MNNQPTEGQVRGNGSVLQIEDIWYTMQGEALFAGSPAMFIRLSGCNLQCPWCDTDYTSVRETLPVNKIIEMIRFHPPTFRPLVVLTGGEPFRQPIGPLVRELDALGYVVQIETNGTLALEEEIPAVIVCSPKTPTLSGRFLKHHRPTCFKYILEADKVSGLDGLPSSTMGTHWEVARPPLGFPQNQIFVQPLDEGDHEANMRNAEACWESAKEHGYKVCIQTHKLIGLP